MQQKSITRSLGTERLSVGLVELPAKKECSAATTCAPSPTAAATRFTGFARPPVDRKNWLPRYVPTPTRTSDTRIFVPTYNARDNIECCSMGRFTSSRKGARPSIPPLHLLPNDSAAPPTDQCVGLALDAAGAGLFEIFVNAEFRHYLRFWSVRRLHYNSTMGESRPDRRDS